MNRPICLLVAAVLAGIQSLVAQELRPTKITLGTYPALSPDGSQVAFGWAGDIWTSNMKGSRARRITTHRGQESRPVYSPDGKQLAFVRELNGQPQVFVVGVRGGIPKQVTFHSSGSRVLAFYPDGQSILISGSRDFGTRSSVRFYRVDLTERKAESLLFDAECAGEASLSPDGKSLLFTREGYDLYRKGYRGTKASQIWLAENLETTTPKFTKVIARETPARSPLWKRDGKSFYYVGNHGENNQFNVWEYELASKKEVQVTEFPEDSVIAPALSGDGSALVFRKEFEFFRMDLTAEGEAAAPVKLKLIAADDSLNDPMVRRLLTKATNLSFSSDGLEMAFAAGGDIWVMDTVAKQPKQITRTEVEEREPVFAADNSGVYFIRESVGNMDIFKAEAADKDKYLWQNDEFEISAITKNKLPKFDLQFLPGGKRIGYIEGQGNLFTADPDGQNARRHVKSWNSPQYDFSPDGKWVVYSVSDNDFNSDVWIKPLDDHREPYNLSRHPDNDTSPRWSPDGKMIAFVGRRFETETDIYYVHLTRDVEEEDKRQKTLESAIEKMKKERKAPPKKDESKKDESKKDEPKKDEPKKDEPKKDEPKKEESGKVEPEPKQSDPKAMSAPKKSAPVAGVQKKEIAKPAPKVEPTPKVTPKPKPDPNSKPKAAPKVDPKPAVAKKPAEPEKKPEEEEKKPEPDKKSDEKKLVEIDFDDLHERLRRISIPNSRESGLFWSHDSKKLAFTATVKGVKGTYVATISEKPTPTLLSSKIGGLARWDAKNDTIYWLVGGVPSTFSKGKSVTYSFRANQEYDVRKYRKAAFHQIWRKMRDSWYDENLNGKDWLAIRKKYENAAATANGPKEFERVVAMLLGELNGSHLGFKTSGTALGIALNAGTLGWADTTPHLGVKLDPAHKGPGLKIDYVIPGSTTDKKSIDLKSGDVILEINGEKVNPETDLTALLNGPSITGLKLTMTPRKGEKQNGKAAKEKKPQGGKRIVMIPGTTWSTATALLQKDRYKKTAEMVEKLSKGRLGYIHVSRMQWNEFLKFEEEIYARGAGKDGLIIDVRDNGGGFTADHLLTVLTPPRHALTVPRGGGPGYPQDRLVYATWTKPITVLCNQNSFSNAEIFSHAIKELGRGQLVGVTTAGGVISTGAAQIMDVGILRIPFRGWYRLSDGADMELNGAVPDHIVWPLPGDAAKGKDRQVEKAVEVLLKEVGPKQE